MQMTCNAAKALQSATELENVSSNLHELPSLTLSTRQCLDLELILNGGFAPLTQFMSKSDYVNVLANKRLSNGQLWPMPIMLDVDDGFVENQQIKNKILLRDQEGLMIATMTIEEIFPRCESEAEAIFATNDETHPGVSYLKNHTKNFYISGQLNKIALPCHYNFTQWRRTPQELKSFFETLNWTKVIGFQTRNPMHRAHQELTLQAAKDHDANVLIHPVVGLTKPGDVAAHARVRCYELILKYYPKNLATLSLLPLGMRMAGPNEALWHALIRKNYGCTHFIIGRDHAGPGKDRQGNDFYPPYAAQELALRHEKEIGIKIIPFEEMAYSEKHQKYFLTSQFPTDDQPAKISGTAFRKKLMQGDPIPEWFSYREVIDELRQAYPPKIQQGFTIFLTGLPSAGKSTIAHALIEKLKTLTTKKVTLLDGDIIRTHLSKGLGFGREDRDENVRRVGFVASCITKHGGIAICALVSPFRSARDAVRRDVETHGGYFEVHVAAPLSVCEERDRKGLYKKARLKLIPQFTGISDPYEEPVAPDIKIDSEKITARSAADLIINKIIGEGFIARV